MYALAGAADKAIEAAFPVTASGGSGIHLELVTTDANYYGAILSGLKLTSPNPLGVPNPKVDLQLSTDGGTTWNPIATGLTMDPYGRGSYAWTPTSQQASSNALLRVVSDDFPSVSGTSAPFSVGSGNDYYVSPGGSNVNDGRSLATPMASLAALLAAYPNIGTGVVLLSAQVKVLGSATQVNCGTVPFTLQSGRRLHTLKVPIVHGSARTRHVRLPKGIWSVMASYRRADGQNVLASRSEPLEFEVGDSADASGRAD